MMTTTTKSILSAVIAFFVLAGAFVLVQHQNSVKSKEIAQYEQNWKATHDSLKYFELQNGELMAEKASYILSEQEMLAELAMSKKELSDIKKKLNSTIAALAKAETSIHIDTIYAPSETVYVGQDTLASNFIYRDDWLSLAGGFRYGSGVTTTKINSIDMSVPLTIGLTEDYKYFVSTPNPYVKITDLKSVINEKSLPKKKSHWGIGVGIGPSVGYDFHHKDLYYGIGGTLSVNYNF